MKITRIEVDGEIYAVAKAKEGSTYCEGCALESKCTRKDNRFFPCGIIDEEEIFVKE